MALPLGAATAVGKEGTEPQSRSVEGLQGQGRDACRIQPGTHAGYTAALLRPEAGLTGRSSHGAALASERLPVGGCEMSSAATGTIPAYAPAGAVCGEATGGSSAGDRGGKQDATPTSRLWPLHLPSPAPTPSSPTAAPSSGSCQVRFASPSVREASEAPSSTTSAVCLRASPARASPLNSEHQNAAWRSPPVLRHRLGTAEDIAHCAAVCRTVSATAVKCTHLPGTFQHAPLLSPGDSLAPTEVTNVAETSPCAPATDGTPTSRLLEQPHAQLQAVNDAAMTSPREARPKSLFSHHALQTPAASEVPTDASITPEVSLYVGGNQSNITSRLAVLTPTPSAACMHATPSIKNVFSNPMDSSLNSGDVKPCDDVKPWSTPGQPGSPEQMGNRCRAATSHATSSAEDSACTARACKGPSASLRLNGLKPLYETPPSIRCAANVEEQGKLTEDVRAVAAGLRSVNTTSSGARFTGGASRGESTLPQLKDHGRHFVSQRYPDTPESSSVAFGPGKRESPAASDATGPPVQMQQRCSKAEELVRMRREGQGQGARDLPLQSQQPRNSRGACMEATQDRPLSSLVRRKPGGSWQAAWMQAQADGGEVVPPQRTAQTELKVAYHRHRDTVAATQAAQAASASAAATRQSAHWKRREMERAVRFAPLATSAAAAAAQSAAATAATAAKDSDAMRREAVRAKAQRLLAMPLGVWRQQQR
jgi:trimeric autotransporter adhesin